MPRGSILPLAALFLAPSALMSGDGIEARLERLAASANPPGKIVRISVANGPSIRVGGRAYRIVDPATGRNLLEPRPGEEIVVVADGAPETPVPTVWRVQTGAFGTEEAARGELERLEGRYGVRGAVRYHPDRASWRVRLGEAPDRAGAGALLDRLRADGRAEAFLVEEPAREVSGVTLRLVDAKYASTATGLSRIAAVPAGSETLSIDGKRYRGIVELRAARDGSVRAVNRVEAESYLRGVVPAELGPEVWPQLEAQKAQAVAARTYLYANLGQFAEDGYDLCGTPRCQVYGGASAEHAMSDRAILATKDEVLVWEGRPIAALYTATCGGHTEDVRNVFPDQAAAPYLQGVPCRAEPGGRSGEIFHVRGREIPPIVDENGVDVSRDAALLAALGVLGDPLDPAALARPVDGKRLRAMTTALARVCGRPAPTGAVPEVRTLADAASAIVADLGWRERARVLLSDEDVAAILRDAEAAALGDEARRALAALSAWAGLSGGAEGRLGIARPPSVARTAGVLARIAEAYAADGLREGTVLEARDGTIRLARGKGELELRFAERPFLVSEGGASRVVSSRLELWAGDRVRFRTERGGTLDFLERLGPLKGASYDRSAAVHSWQVRRSAAELQEAVDRRLAVGDVRDLAVSRRGVSGRIAELRVVGSTGEGVVRGFDVRGLLDLRESLTSIEVQRDAEGNLVAVVFAGRGWGHGVGLCQVGAFGMAQRGAGYREILAHYYRGATLGRASAPVP